MYTPERRFPRHRIEAPLLVRGIASAMSHAYRGHSTSLSEGGVGAIVSGELSPGQIVLMEVVLPGELQPLVVRARVCYRNDLECGFQFLGIEARAQQIIRTACAMG
jgi:c-di-GMP-binding flagellar brake protein YcgR